jgi:hypothetical protein
MGLRLPKDCPGGDDEFDDIYGYIPLEGEGGAEMWLEAAETWREDCDDEDEFYGLAFLSILERPGAGLQAGYLLDVTQAQELIDALQNFIARAGKSAELN